MNDFFATIYELGSLFYLGDFSEDLYDHNLYMSVGIVMLVSSLAGMLIYYYAIDSTRWGWDKWYKWLLFVVIVGIINVVYAYWTVLSKLEAVYAEVGEGIPFTDVDFFNFSTVDFLWTLIFCFVFSLLVKWKSVNCRKTPF
jgi:hypothetical protein